MLFREVAEEERTTLRRQSRTVREGEKIVSHVGKGELNKIYTFTLM